MNASQVASGSQRGCVLSRGRTESKGLLSVISSCLDYHPFQIRWTAAGVDHFKDSRTLRILVVFGISKGDIRTTFTFPLVDRQGAATNKSR